MGFKDLFPGLGMQLDNEFSAVYIDLKSTALNLFLPLYKYT